MKVTTERLPKSLIALDIEPDAKTIEAEMNKAAKRVANKVAIPGFRKGKAPRFIIENYYGKEIIVEEATDEIINVAFKAALEQEKIEPIAQAKLEKLETDPFRFRILVPVEPTVTLGDYAAIRLPLELEEVTPDVVDASLDQLRDKHVALQELEEARPAETGDQLTVHLETLVDGVPVEDIEADDEDEDEGEFEADDDSDDEDDDDEDDDDEDEDDDSDEDDDDDFEDGDEDEDGPRGEETTLVLEEKRLVPELYAGLVGAAVGETREINAPMPADHSDKRIAGKTVTFKVTVKDIQARVVPAWEELPALENFEGDWEAMQADVRSRLERNTRDHAQRALVDEFVNKVVEGTEYDIPDALIHERAHELLHEQVDQLARYGITLEQYLQITNKTHDQAVDELLGPAEERLKQSLAMRHILLKEGLTVQGEEVDAEVEKLIGEYPEAQRDMVRERLTGDLKPTVAASVLDRKLRDRLVEIATGTAAPAAAAEAEEAA
ncbi:MAG TPA: trigger factor [Herpetosiphonaceae bacterium]|nr:trigger factor [Herpetosiphonaceae bacterium]